MRNQVEIIYVVVFLTVAILIILLAFYALTYNNNQNLIFNRFTSLSTLSNYFIGNLQTLLTQEGYASSYIAGTNGWGKDEWASFPPQCMQPQPCQAAVDYYNKLLTSGIRNLLDYEERYLYIYQYYYPYNISFNFSNNYGAGLIGDCNAITSGQYNYNFSVYVQGLYLDINGPSSGSIIPFESTSNITNNPAFYLYNLAYKFSQEDFSQCSLQDCLNTLYNNGSTDNCAQDFEQFSNDPNIQCKEAVIPYPCRDIPLCQPCLFPRAAACRVVLKCSDNQYNVYVNGFSLPQSIVISSVVFYENISVRYYLQCTYNCTAIFNATNNQSIYKNCTLTDYETGCSPFPSGCNNLNVSQMNVSQLNLSQLNISNLNINQNGSVTVYTFQYYNSSEVQCFGCVIGSPPCNICQPDICLNNGPPPCPETIPFPDECLQQPISNGSNQSNQTSSGGEGGGPRTGKNILIR
jgi:hypothetical protein